MTPVPRISNQFMFHQDEVYNLPFPVHSCMNPMRIQIVKRCTSPRVLRKALHPEQAFRSASALILLQIWSYSSCTSALLRSPFPWYRTSIALASPVRSLETSHLGLSGMTNSPASWKSGNKTCSMQGIRHDQLLSTLRVAKAIPAAVIEPQNQIALYRPVRTPRWRGCATSAISNGAAVCEKPTPAPVTMRAPKNTQGCWTATWITDARITSEAPIAIQGRRPSLSATYEAGIKVKKAPKDTAAMMRPSALALISFKKIATFFQILVSN